MPRRRFGRESLTSRRRAGRAGQGRAGQAGLLRRRAHPSLAARTGPSSSAAHKPMARRPLPRAWLPRPRGGQGGHRGVGGPRAAAEALPGAACGGRTPAWTGDPRTGTPCRFATQDFLGSSENSAPFPGLQTSPYELIKYPFSGLDQCLGRQVLALAGSLPPSVK